MVEFLIVFAFVVTLISLLQPSLARLTERGRLIECANHLRQLTQAHLLYADDYDGAQVSPTDYLTTLGFGGWPNVQGIPTSSLLILDGYLPQNPSLFMCPSDTGERKDGPSRYIRSASFSYTRNGYVFRYHVHEVPSKSVLLAEEHNEAPMNDGTFYANRFDLLSDRHDGWGHMSTMDGAVQQLDTHHYNKQPALWRRDHYLFPKN